VRRLELRKPGLRGLLLEPLCIHDHVGGAHRNRTDQAICLQGKSGFLARTPKLVVGYANDSSGSHSLAAYTGNFTVGTATRNRTWVPPVKSRGSV
jgi:hypothetical protein